MIISKPTDTILRVKALPALIAFIFISLIRIVSADANNSAEIVKYSTKSCPQYLSWQHEFQWDGDSPQITGTVYEGCPSFTWNDSDGCNSVTCNNIGRNYSCDVMTFFDN